MSHAKSLRVIGQTLEAANVPTFELEKYGAHYMVWSSSVSGVGEAFIRNALSQDEEPSKRTREFCFCFTPADISRLDAQARKQRRRQWDAKTSALKLVSHGLRTLGEFFDHVQVHAFRVEWSATSICIDFQQVDSKRTCRMFTPAELQYLCEKAKMQRREGEETLVLF